MRKEWRDGDRWTNVEKREKIKEKAVEKAKKD